MHTHYRNTKVANTFKLSKIKIMTAIMLCIILVKLHMSMYLCLYFIIFTFISVHFEWTVRPFVTFEWAEFRWKHVSLRFVDLLFLKETQIHRASWNCHVTNRVHIAWTQTCRHSILKWIHCVIWPIWTLSFVAVVVSRNSISRY